MARDRGSGGAPGDVVDLVEDLDDPWSGAPGGHRGDGGHHDDGRARPRRPRWLRSRWTLPVVVLALALLLEVSLGRQVRAAGADDLAQAQALGALQLGGASVMTPYDGRPPAHDEQGRLVTQLQVQVLNGGERPVQLVARGASEPLLEVVDPPATASVPPQGTGSLALQVAVDCSRVPPPVRSSSDGGAAASDPLALDLDVVLSGAGAPAGGAAAVRHRYLVADAGWVWGGVPQQLAWACDPSSSGRYGLDTAPQADGTMRVVVRNDTALPLLVGLQASPWLHARSSIDLSAPVPAGERLEAVLALDPDCPRVPSPTSGGLDPELDVVALQDGSAQSLQYPPSGQLLAWAARQTALACG